MDEWYLLVIGLVLWVIFDMIRENLKKRNTLYFSEGPLLLDERPLTVIADYGVDLEAALDDVDRSPDVNALIEHYIYSLFLFVELIERAERCIRLGVVPPPAPVRVYNRLIPRLERQLIALPDSLVVRILQFETPHLRLKVRELRNDNLADNPESLMDTIEDILDDMLLVSNVAPLLTDDIERVRVQLVELRIELGQMVRDLSLWERRFSERNPSVEHPSS